MTATAHSNPAAQLRDTVGGSVVRIGRRGGRGCGFVVAEDAVVTNAHNLRDRTTEVTFADGRAVQARASAVDRDGDLVVLEVDTGEAPPITWADEPVELGAPVFSVVRLADGTRVTAGAVSGTGRSFRGPRGRRITGSFEHTAPLAKGSSGSPVVDAEGRLVGISTLRLGDGFSMAIAAEADLLKRIELLRQGRSPERRLLGVALAPSEVSQRLRRSVGLEDRDGVLIRQVETGSPADEGGLRPGDLLTEVGGVPVTSVDDVAAALDALPDGDGLPIHVVRGSDDLDLVVQFPDAEPQDDAEPSET